MLGAPKYLSPVATVFQGNACVKHYAAGFAHFDWFKLEYLASQAHGCAFVHPVTGFQVDSVHSIFVLSLINHLRKNKQKSPYPANTLVP